MERLSVFCGGEYVGYVHTLEELQQWSWALGSAWAQNMAGEIVWRSND
jgi:hypothetical protein